MLNKVPSLGNSGCNVPLQSQSTTSRLVKCLSQFMKEVQPGGEGLGRGFFSITSVKPWFIRCKGLEQGNASPCVLTLAARAEGESF